MACSPPAAATENRMEVHRKEFRLELSYDPGIPLLGIYLKSARTPTGKDIYIPVFTAALLNTAKASRPPGRPVGEWIRGGGTWNTALPQNKAETCHRDSMDAQWNTSGGKGQETYLLTCFVSQPEKRSHSGWWYREPHSCRTQSVLTGDWRWLGAGMNWDFQGCWAEWIYSSCEMHITLGDLIWIKLCPPKCAC